MYTFEQTVIRWWTAGNLESLGYWSYVSEWCHGAYAATGNDDFLFLSLLAARRSIMGYEEYADEVENIIYISRLPEGE